MPNRDKDKLLQKIKEVSNPQNINQRITHLLKTVRVRLYTVYVRHQTRLSDDVRTCSAHGGCSSSSSSNTARLGRWMWSRQCLPSTKRLPSGSGCHWRRGDRGCEAGGTHQRGVHQRFTTPLPDEQVCELYIKVKTTLYTVIIVQELCESRGGRPGLSVLTSLLVSVDVKNYWTMLRHWSQLVPNMSTDIWGR